MHRSERRLVKLKSLKSSVPPLRSTLPVAQPMSWRSGEENSDKRGYGYLTKHPLCVYCEQTGRVAKAIVVERRMETAGRVGP